MKTAFAGTAALLALLLAAAPLPAGEETAGAKRGNVWQERLDAVAPSIVSVKFVLNLRVTMIGRGEMPAQERNVEARGVLVNDRGLVLTSNTTFNPQLGFPPQFRNRIEVKSTHRELRVLFGNEEEEYEAQIVARDSKLGLAFIQILDLKGRKVAPVDFKDGGVLRVGQDLYGVTRLPRGFDCAPMLGKLTVTARVEKPREMWAIAGSFGGMGLPVFDLSDRPVGVLSVQHAAGGAGGGGSATFLLPARKVRTSIEQAEKRAEEILEEAKEKKAEEAAPEKEGEEEKPGEGGEKKPGGGEEKTPGGSGGK